MLCRASRQIRQSVNVFFGRSPKPEPMAEPHCIELATQIVALASNDRLAPERVWANVFYAANDAWGIGGTRSPGGGNSGGDTVELAIRRDPR